LDQVSVSGRSFGPGRLRELDRRFATDPVIPSEPPPIDPPPAAGRKPRPSVPVRTGRRRTCMNVRNRTDWSFVPD